MPAVSKLVSGNAKSNHDIMERNVPDFDDQYKRFCDNLEHLDLRLTQTDVIAERERLQLIRNALSTLDVKMRLAFGIREIRLNNDFVSNKQNDLKICHLLYYKLADLWFAYDSYLKFYKQVVGSEKNNVEWIEADVHNNYSISDPIVLAKNNVEIQFQELYTNVDRRNLLLEYLIHCKTSASKSQIRRIDRISAKIQQSNFTLTNGEVLTITYAVRNNFVHNGETTVVPDNFGYENKAQLLKILYSYLTILLLVSSNITFGRI